MSDWQHSLQTGLPKLISLLLIVWLAVLAAKLSWAMFAPSDFALPVASQGASAEEDQPQVVVYAAGIAPHHLFGKAEVVKRIAPREDVKRIEDETQETSLNLVLRGVFAQGDGKGVAIIVVQGKDEKAIAVGEEVLRKVTLLEVYADHVLLETSRGDIEKLSLNKEEKKLAKKRGSSSNSKTRNKNLTTVENERLPMPQRLSALRKEVVKSPKEFSKMISIRPYEENGDDIGYELVNKSGNDFFYDVGFQDGDVVTQINDIKLDRRSNGVRAMRQLRRAKDVSVTVRRAGQDVVLQHSFE